MAIYLAVMADSLTAGWTSSQQLALWLTLWLAAFLALGIIAQFMRR